MYNMLLKVTPPANAGGVGRQRSCRPLAKCYVSSLRNVMRASTLIGMFVVPAANAELGWFERKWISDADQSMLHNEQVVDSWDEHSRELFKSTYGKMEWHVYGGIVKVLIAGTELNSIYSYRPSNNGGYELMLEYGEVIPLKRTEQGFCVEFKNSESATGVITDCYRPLGET
jgi:hypothetical protein